MNGKALRIEVGVARTERGFMCQAYDHEWTLAYRAGGAMDCPNCQSHFMFRATGAGLPVSTGVGKLLVEALPDPLIRLHLVPPRARFRISHSRYFYSRTGFRDLLAYCRYSCSRTGFSNLITSKTFRYAFVWGSLFRLEGLWISHRL